jgi:hypothetical protein
LIPSTTTRKPRSDRKATNRIDTVDYNPEAALRDHATIDERQSEYLIDVIRQIVGLSDLANGLKTYGRIESVGSQCEHSGSFIG